MSVQDDDLVIGEAVVLDLHPASFATRMGALILDLLVLGAVALVVGLLLGGTSFFLDSAALSAVTLATVVLLFVGMPTGETFSRGRSLGKLAVGLRVVRDDGGRSARGTPSSARCRVRRALPVAGSVAIIASLPTQGQARRRHAGRHLRGQRARCRVPVAPV